MTTKATKAEVLRLLTSDLYVDAPLSEIAEVADTSEEVVQMVLDDLKLRRVLSHARIISEQLQMGLDEHPDYVITIALEFFFRCSPKTPRADFIVKKVMRRIGISDDRAKLARRARAVVGESVASALESAAKSAH